MKRLTATLFFSAGFTLIETLIYIALLGFIMTGALLSAYQIIDGAGKMNTADTTEQEGNFVMRKIDWALSGTSSQAAVLLPAPGAYASTLSRIRSDGTAIVIRKNGTAIQVSKDGGATYLPLTSRNVAVSALQFHAIPSRGSGPGGIEASTTIDGVAFYTKRYARQ